MRRALVLGLLLVAGLFVTVVFGPAAEGIVITGAFVDDDGHLFEEDIDAIAAAGVTKGCNPPANTRYCPDLDVQRGAMAAFLRRALSLPDANTDFFRDDDQSIFEGDINAIAAAGITKGCNPPGNDRFCPDDFVSRGEMAAFLRRALKLPTVQKDFFIDDSQSVFEADINAIAADGITRGCNPPTNNRYCPSHQVDRGAMAAFLRRALELPGVILQIPAGDHSAMRCTKDGLRCSLTVDLSANRSYRIQEGWFQVTPASGSEQSAFASASTSVTVTLDGTEISLTQLPQQNANGLLTRKWHRDVSFTAGTHTLVARWRWNGSLTQTNTITIRAAG